MTIKPIETRYAGCRFRSRLEARWAVFFDDLEIPWEYEPEGFDLPGGAYLPDFRLSMNHPDGPLWFEVKPPAVRSASVIDPRWSELTEATGLNLSVMFGMHRNGDRCIQEIWDIKEGRRKSYSPGLHWGLTMYPDGRIFERDPFSTGDAGLFEGYTYLNPTYGAKTIARAYDKASSARFEHGEHG
jgi:hypothetical protein